MKRLQLRDLMVPSTFGTKIANRGLRQYQDAASPYIAARSTMMAQSMHMRFVMIGLRVQKITIHQLQKPTFTCTSHRNLRLKASRELDLAVESEVSSKASLLTILEKVRLVVLYMEIFLGFSVCSPAINS